MSSAKKKDGSTCKAAFVLGWFSSNVARNKSFLWLLVVMLYYQVENQAQQEQEQKHVLENQAQQQQEQKHVAVVAVAATITWARCCSWWSRVRAALPLPAYRRPAHLRRRPPDAQPPPLHVRRHSCYVACPSCFALLFFSLLTRSASFRRLDCICFLLLCDA